MNTSSTGIYLTFQGLKIRPDKKTGQKETLLRKGLTRYGLILFITVLMLLAIPYIACATVSVELHLERSETVLMTPLRMQVKISGSRSIDSEPVINGTENFIVIRGGQTTSVEIINGRLSSSLEITYFLTPKKTGRFTIGPVKCVIDGKSYKSNTKTLTVTNETPATDRHENAPVFLTSSISRHTAYVESQIFYILRLYHRTRVSDISLSMPDTAFLSFRQLGKPVEYTRIYNGKEYSVLEVRFALSASKAGRYLIMPAKMNMRVYRPQDRNFSSDPFNFFFNDPFMQPARPASFRSNPVRFKVLPLPEKNKPANFSGLVGNFQLTSSLKPRKVKAGNSTTLTVTIKGTGNITRIPDIRLPELKGLKIYADRPVIKTWTDSNGIHGSKTMIWALVPERADLYHIPPLSISYFDVSANRYHILKTPSWVIEVHGNIKEKAGASGAVKLPDRNQKRQKVTELGYDILPAHTSIRFFKTDHGTGMRFHGVFVWIILFCPPLLYCIIFAVARFKKKASSDPAASGPKKALKEFLHQYKQCKLRPDELLSITRNYLNRRFRLNIGTLTCSEAEQLIIQHGGTKETAQRFSQIIKNIEELVYTGQSTHDISTKGNELLKLVKQIEKETKPIPIQVNAHS